jgi:hypothetical protein
VPSESGLKWNPPRRGVEEEEKEDEERIPIKNKLQSKGEV